MALLPKNKIKIPHGRQAITAALDVGTTKITCLIAQVNEKDDAPQPGIRVMGIGHQGAKGIKAGVITDMEAAEDTIRSSKNLAARTLPVLDSPWVWNV